MSDPTTPPPVETTAPAAPPASAKKPDTATAEPAKKTPEVEPAAAQKKARRGTVIAGALALPLVTLGVILLAVPLAVWYLSTVIRTLVVVVANIVSGSGAAKDANATLGQIDPAALGGVTLGFAIVGAVFVVAGCLVSYFVLRAHRVDRPGYVTGFGVTVGLVISAILTATVGALTGLIFGTARTVAQVLGNAALGIALTTIGAAIVTVATGIVVWLWMGRLFRTPAPASAPPRDSDR
ncbi:MAG: hypothetical protein J0H23_09180 [Micrococcales bacterium]|nr:hypothetical protein [Micrococcales bacterium]OJX69814.1 MAG: hypothetical protein BGO94_15225 [Micrococcales bacterium 72-143]